MSATRRVLAAVAWLLAAILISAGSAGIVTGVNQPPGSPARAELTWAADQAADEALDVALTDLRTLAATVDLIGDAGRDALSALPTRDTTRLALALTTGQARVDAVASLAGRLRADLAAVPGIGASEALVLSPAVTERYDAIVRALAEITDLQRDWAGLTDGGLIAIRLTTLLDQHETEAGEAIRLGSVGDYEGALLHLGVAETAISDAGPIRDRLRNTTDTGVLDEWLRRNERYDAVLRTLYELLQASEGGITPEIQRAFELEQIARRDLPADSRGLVIILAEIGQGGMNQAVISIEQLRGILAAAIEAVAQPAVPVETAEPTEPG